LPLLRVREARSREAMASPRLLCNPGCARVVESQYPGGRAAAFVSPARNRLRKNPCAVCILTSAAEAVTENRLFIAAVNRCVTQNQVPHRVFPQVGKALGR